MARETVRQAVRDLVLEGRLRRRGRGTVVAGPKLAQPLSLASYTEGVRKQGRTPGRTLVTLDRFPCPDPLAAETGLTRGEPVWHLERVLLADDERVGLESTYVAVARVPRLDSDFDPDSSFYGYLAAQGIAFGDADERIETVLATPREALLIGTPARPADAADPPSVPGHGGPAAGAGAVAVPGRPVLLHHTPPGLTARPRHDRPI